jgi:hypothetical protein
MPGRRVVVNNHPGRDRDRTSLHDLIPYCQSECSDRHARGLGLLEHVTMSSMGGRAKAWCLFVHVKASHFHGGQGESLVRPYTRGSVTLSRGGWAKACCLLIPVEAFLSHGGQGESPVPPYTRGSIFLSRGSGRTPGASLNTWKHLSFTGGAG